MDGELDYRKFDAIGSIPMVHLREIPTANSLARQAAQAAMANQGVDFGKHATGFAATSTPLRPAAVGS